MNKKDLQKLRQDARETTEREWIRDSIALRDKNPLESLRVMFDMLNFAEKLSKLAAK